MKFKPKSSQMKQYETRYPESQVIKMVELAKYMEIYNGAPDIVSKGKQEIVKVFAADIKSNGLSPIRCTIHTIINGLYHLR